MPLEEAEGELASVSLLGSQSALGQTSPSFELQEPTKNSLATPDEPSPVLAVSSHRQSAPSKPAPASVQPAASDSGTAEPTTSDSTAVQPTTSQPTTSQLRLEVSAKVGPSAGSETIADREQLPRAIAEAPQAVWYVRPPGGGQFGPADGNLFYQWMKESRVARDALVWRDGWPQWRVAAEAFEETYGPTWLVDPEPTADPENGLPVTGLPLAGLPATGLPATGQPATGQPATGQPISGLPVKRDGLTAARRKRIRNNYAVGIAILAILAIVLVSVLIYVTMMK